VSIVIPTRNRWTCLASASLPCALAQREVEIEVIVVDDGSTDETPIRLAGVRDPRVRRLRHERPRGVAAARNAGIHAARGEWVALLDDDDLWSPSKLRCQLDAVQQTDAEFVYCGGLVLDERLRVIHRLETPQPDDLRFQLLTRYAIPAGPSSVIARTEVLRRLGGFDQRLSYLADWDMWLRLAWSSAAAACPEPLVGYVRHRGRMLPTRRGILAELDYMLGKHAEIGLQIDRARFVRWIALQHRQAGRRLAASRILVETAVASRRPSDMLRAGATLLESPVVAPVRRVGRGASRGRPHESTGPDPDWLVDLRLGGE
jgi:hypothetical protein